MFDFQFHWNKCSLVSVVMKAAAATEDSETKG